MVDPSTTRERELERFRTIVEVAGEPIYTLNEAGRFTYVNDALLEATGYNRTELLGEDVSTLLPEAAIERAEAAIAALLESDERSRTVEIPVRTAAGERRQAEVTLALLPDDVGGTVGVARAID
jgi:PAS domain S-box-containing protein